MLEVIWDRDVCVHVVDFVSDRFCRRRRAPERVCWGCRARGRRCSRSEIFINLFRDLAVLLTLLEIVELFELLEIEVEIIPGLPVLIH